MGNAVFKPGDQLGSFVIQEREEDYQPLQRYRAKHAHNHTNALLCVRDLRHAPPSLETALAFKMRAEPLFALRTDTIPALLEVDIQNGFQWAAFAFPQGTPLHDFIAVQGPLQPLAGAQLLRAIGATLHEARSAGAHGLLRTDAIFVDAEGTFQNLLHFGLASLFEISPETLLHCPPEHWNAKRDPSEGADIYSAAAIVWEALSGNEPGATSEPDPRRKSGLRQRFPHLRSVRPEVSDGLSRLLYDWTSHDECERPASWMLALIELEAELGALLRVAHIPQTAADLASEESEPPTLPNSMAIRKRLEQPMASETLKAAQTSANGSAISSESQDTPSADLFEHAETIPAPPPFSAIFASAAELPAPQSPKPTHAQAPAATQAPAPTIEPLSNPEAKPSRPKSRARTFAAFAMGVLFFGSAGMVGGLSFRSREPAPRSEAHTMPPAQTSQQVPTVHNQIMHDHNSNAPKSEPEISKSRPRPRANAKKPELPRDPFDPAQRLNVRIYIGTQ